MFLWNYLLLTAKFITDTYVSSPSTCLKTSSNLVSLVTCLDKFTAPHDYYTATTYAQAQPTTPQRAAWSSAIQALLAVDGNCASASVPPILASIYTISPFGAHCVLYETAARCGTYAKGWGFAVVPARRAAVARTVHVSAPHPGYDLGTVEQAAAVYEGVGARSLLVAGRTRTSYLSPSDCIARTGPRQDYYMTDPAHNDKEPFFDASLAMYAWQHAQPEGCHPASCAFLQMHGKGATTCAKDTIFISAGIANSTAGQEWYRDTTLPSARLASALARSFPGDTIALPPVSRCALTATKNVVGRYFNGVTRADVCSTAANVENASGVWVHAEQARVMRDRNAYAGWVQALREALDPVVKERPLQGHSIGERRYGGDSGWSVWRAWYFIVSYLTTP